MWKRFHPDISARFEELRELCTQAGDKASLAMGMAGMTVEYVLHGRVRDASRLASEYMALVESIAEPALTIALSFAGIVAKHETGETTEALRWTQAVIDLTAQDFDRGMVFFESPRATALAWRGTARFRNGLPGWHEDFEQAMAIADRSDTLSRSTVLTYKYAGIPRGLYLADDDVLREVEEVMKSVEQSSDDMAVVLARMNLAIALIHHGADRARGYDDIRALRETCIKERFALNMLPFFETYLALELADRGEVDAALEQWRVIAEGMERAGAMSNLDLPLMFAAEQLLARGDYEEATRQIDRLAVLGEELDWGSRELAALRLRVLLAQARGDDAAYRDLREQYRAMANDLGFEGHMAWVAEMH